MTISNRLKHLIAELDRDRSLYAPDEWQKRMGALDRLEFCLVHEDVETNKETIDSALKISADLEAANREFYKSLRRDIQLGHGAQRLMQCAHEPSHDEENGDSARGETYDDLDVLISGVLQFEEPGEDLADLTPEMVFYQPTPARQIFHLIHRARLNKRDVLVDLGAGLGHVTILAAICTSAHCVGIERELVYVASAKKCAIDLKLENATFLQQDVRHFDLSLGTVFYLYTPFTGELLRDVLNRLRREATQRQIRVGTLGPCTLVVAEENWLQTTDTLTPGKVALFGSV